VATFAPSSPKFRALPRALISDDLREIEGERGSGGEAWARNDAFSPGYTNGRPCGRRLALGQQDFYKIVRRTP
jgi:hypothetical protein